MASVSELLGINTIKAFFNKNFEDWLARRIPNQAQHQLNSRNIMIYPTRFGFSYLGIVILVFLLGTNYQNNIILLFSYLLASLFISVMLHSFYNFSQLRFYSMAEQRGYVGETLLFPITISTEKVHFDLNIHFTDKALAKQIVKIEQCQQGSQIVNVPYKSVRRGKQLLGRMTIFSEYSFGLFKSKTVLDFGHYAIVYPKPKSLVAGQFSLSSQRDEPNIESYQTANITGTDDFSELKSFVRGESKARTAWKQLAKGQGHYSKHYQASQSQLQWLKLSDMPGSDLETRLSYLSFLVGELTASNQTFGLELTANINIDSINNDSISNDSISNDSINNDLMNIAPNTGLAHQKSCLTALALYT